MDEYQALLRNNTWELVPAAKNQNIVSNKWVYRVKYKANGSLDKYKTRLVAKGFQQTAGVNFFETFSPVIKPSTIRVVFILAVTYGWDIKQIDINNAFLNGELQETVFMTQLEGFEDSSKPNCVCKLKRLCISLNKLHELGMKSSRKL